MTGRTKLRVASTGLGVCLLAALAWWQVDFGAFARSLASLGAPTVALLGVLATVDRFAMALKWRQVAEPIGVQAPFGRFLSAYYGASFLVYCLPNALGGDVYRAYRLSRGGSGHAVVASVVMERAIGVLANLALAWLGLLYLIWEHGSAGAGSGVAVLLALSIGGAGALWLSLRADVHAWLLQRLPVRGWAARVRELARAYAAFAQQRGALARNFGLACLENAIQLAVLLVAARGVGIDAPLATLVSALAVVQVLRRASVVLDGWGLGTAVVLVVLGLVGVHASLALAMTLVGHAAGFLASLPGGLVLLRGERVPPPPAGPAAKRGALGIFVRRFLVPQWASVLWYALRYRARVSLRAEVELSPNLSFGPGCTVSSFTKIKATEGPLVVGARTGFGTGCFVAAGEAGIHIGEDVLVGPNVSIVGSSYVTDQLDVPFERQGHASRGVVIGNNVWIGAGCVIADGAQIGDNSIVAANSLVLRRHPPNVVVQGAPARVVLKRSPAEKKEEPCETGSSGSSATPLES